ncbi:MAG: serine/threonine protein kinase [Myxococcales bacterium]|nr:serine/threonine protein kinase [Myxococcales bacterium]
MTADNDLIGRVLEDRYRILRLIGRGGMGAVYEAEAVRLGRRCAVKVVLPEFAGSETVVQRFAREAQIVAKIKHPNVVEIFDTGTTPDGAGYIAMELLTGESLEVTLRREGRLPWPRVRSIAVQICRALSAAHAQHVVHRDMKPENCYRVVRDGEEVIKVLDFGIAKLADPAPGADSQRLTATNAVIGTYAYMAFEQICGQELDHRVDVWAVGVMLYEMLTGVLPFRGDNQGQIWTAIFTATPPPMAEQAPDAAIPPQLEDIVRCALARDREQRWPYADTLAAALLAVPADAAGPVTRAGPTGRRDAAARSDPAALAATVAATPYPDSPTERVDPAGRTAFAERAATAESTRPEPLAAAPAPPRRRLSRRALLLFGSLGAPALIAAVALGTGDGLGREERRISAAPRADPPPPPRAEAELQTPVSADPAVVEARVDHDAKTIAPDKGDPPNKSPADRKSHAERVAADVRRLQASARDECIGVVGKVTVDLVVSARTGRATRHSVDGLAGATLLARCVERLLKEHRFPKGAAGDPDFREIVTFEAR